jgi:hypothetical protein
MTRVEAMIREGYGLEPAEFKVEGMYRKEFSYDLIRTILPGSFFFLIGVFFILHILGYCFWRQLTTASKAPKQKIVPSTFRATSEACFRVHWPLVPLERLRRLQPAVVVDGKGLFYRSFGGMIAWADVGTVEADMQGEK